MNRWLDCQINKFLISFPSSSRSLSNQKRQEEGFGAIAVRVNSRGPREKSSETRRHGAVHPVSEPEGPPPEAGDDPTEIPRRGLGRIVHSRAVRGERVAAAGVAAGAAATDSDAQAASKAVTAVLPALLWTVIVPAPPAPALAATPTEAGGA